MIKKGKRKRNGLKIRLVSAEGTGVFYVTMKNAKTKPERMVCRKYDKVLRRHVEFREAKIKG